MSRDCSSGKRWMKNEVHIIIKTFNQHHFNQAYPIANALLGIPNRETWAQRWPQWRLRRWATNAIAAAAVIVINVGSRSWRWRRPVRKWGGCPGRSPLAPQSVVRIRSSSRGPHKWPASSYVGFKMQSTPLWSLVKHDTCLGTHKHAHTHIDTQILGTGGVCVILSSRSGH